MPRTAAHIAAVHMLASERVAAGKPLWAEKVRIGHVLRDDSLTFEEKREGVVAALKRTRWFKQADPDESWGVHEIIDEHLAHAEDADEFDGCLDELYDHADYDRVWIDAW